MQDIIIYFLDYLLDLLDVSLLESESENKENNLESDIIDDSDNDKHYKQLTSNEDSYELNEMEYLRRASKRQRSIVSPAAPAADNDEPASPTPGTSAGFAVPAFAMG